MADTAIFLVGLAILAVCIAILASLSSIVQKWVSDQGGETPTHKQSTNNEYQNGDHLNEERVIPPIGSRSVDAVANAIDAYHQKRDTHERARSKREKVTIVVLGVTAFFALTATVASFVSDWIFYEQLADAKKSTISTNRAWIAPSRMVLNFPLETPGPIRAALYVENTGREPAIDVVYAFRSFLVPYLPEEPRNTIIERPNRTCEGLDPDAVGGLVIYPAKTEVIILSNFQDSIDNRASAIAARNRSQTLIVEGCIAYRTFKDAHTSKFRFFLRDVPGPSCVTIDVSHINCPWQFHPIGIGNEAN
jgi:hypothetical protein